MRAERMNQKRSDEINLNSFSTSIAILCLVILLLMTSYSCALEISPLTLELKSDSRPQYQQIFVRNLLTLHYITCILLFAEDSKENPDHIADSHRDYTQNDGIWDLIVLFSIEVEDDKGILAIYRVQSARDTKAQEECEKWPWEDACDGCWGVSFLREGSDW